MNILDRVRAWLLSILIIVVGMLIVDHHFNVRSIDGLGEALVIAGLLSLIVDPLLKGVLLREASRGIFVHLLGFEHRPEVKDKLKEIIFETKLLRKTFDMKCSIEPQDGCFYMTVEFDSAIVNPTNNAEGLTPFMEFDRAHRVEVQAWSFTSSDGKYKWSGTPPAIQKEPGIDTFKAEHFWIEPEKKGITYKANGRYKIMLKHGYSHFHAGIPTLRMSIRGSISPRYELSASSASVENINYWQYDSIQMVGDHVTLRWRKKGQDWL